MKKFTRLLSLLLALVMLLPLASCGGRTASSNDGEIVISYGDFSIREKDFMYILSLFKSQMIGYYQTMFAQYYGVQYTEAQILELELDENTTVAKYIKDVATEFAQQMIIFEQLCADAGITITDEKDLSEIETYLSDMEFAYGGTDLFQIELAKLGISKSAIERYLRANVNYELIYEYRYGEGGIAEVDKESVVKNFLDNYIRYEGALYTYTDSATNKSFLFDFTDEEIKTYFNTNFVKVRHILYKTVDAKGNKLPEADVSAKKSKADAAAAAITSGEKTLDDYKNETEDNGYEYIFTYGTMVSAFETASFEMQAGEVRVVETEYGYHVIEKQVLTDEDFLGEKQSDGSYKNGYKDQTISEMSKDKINKEALALNESLVKGEATEFPKESEDKAYYLNMQPSVIDKNDENYASFIEVVSKLKENEYGVHDVTREGTYVIKRLPISESDLSDTVYAAIEEDLAFTSFTEYTRSFYDKVTINNTVLDKFDVVALPMLDSELYTFG